MINAKEKLEQDREIEWERGAALDLVVRGDLFAEVTLKKNRNN